jgi:hypothetical protein
MTRRRTWPLFLIGLPAAVAVWSGWVGLGGLCGFGLIHPLPGIVSGLQLNTAITLPVGVEAYGGYAMGVWADAATPQRVRRFAFWSAFGSLALGLLGQVAFHLLAAAHYARAPWPVVVFVSCIPVAALGFGMGLHQLLIHTEADQAAPAPAGVPTRVALVDEVVRTISPALTVHHEPPAREPEPLPDGPAPPAEPEGPDEDVRAVLAAWDAPEPVPVPASPEEDDIEAEAARLFASGADAAPVRPPVRPARTRTASPRAEWDPATVGRTWDEVAALARTLSRNQLAAQLPCSRGTADKLREKYNAPALNGTR